MKAEIPYMEAKAIADDLVTQLRNHCFRIEIAGSIRREKAIVGDIEIVCIPKPYEIGLFESGLAAVVNKWPKVKGDMVYGKTKYTQRILPQDIKLDLFFVTTNNWGLQFAIRTGSADFSHHTLATGWVRNGYTSKDGYLTKDDIIIPVYEEKDLFDLIRISYIEPKFRI